MTSEKLNTLHRLGNVMMFAGIGVVFLILPLLFLPWTIDALEIHKQLILIFGSGVSVAGLMLRWMHSTEIHIQWHPLLAVYAAFVLMLAISSFFSLHGYTSWMGQGKQEYLSFATHFSLLNLWFVFLQLKKKVLHFPLLLLFAGAALMALIGLLRFIFPNLLSTWFVGTGMQFVAYMLTLGIAGGFFFAILGHIRGSFPAYAAYSMRVLGLFLFISSMIFALSIDGDGSRWIWAGIIASIGIPMIFITNRQDLMKNVNVYIPLIIGFVLACIFFFLQSPVANIFPADVVPSLSSSWNIGWSSLDGGRLLTGSGAGTYSIDYAANQSAQINATPFWNIIFDRGYNIFLTLLPTIGIIGTFIFLALGLAFFIMPLLELKKIIKKDQVRHLSLLAAALFFTFALWFGSMSMTLVFLLIALCMFLSRNMVRKFDLDFSNARLRFFGVVKQISVSLIIVVLMVLAGAKYISEIALAKTLTRVSQSAAVSDVLPSLDRAARFNKQSDIVYRNLAGALLFQIDELASSAATSEEELTQAILMAINAAQRATEIAPNRAENWRMLGDVYFELSPVHEDTSLFAIHAYQRASELYPINPAYKTQLGRALLVRFDALGAQLGEEDVDAEILQLERDALMADALSVLEEAVSLKPDYASAQFYLAAAYERNGDLQGAIDTFTEIRAQHPNDIGVLLRLGLLYLRQGSTAQAILEFTDALKIDSTYSNAYWFLSFAREQRGEIDEAIAVLESILIYDSENVFVRQRIDQLRQGQIQEEIPAPLDEEGVVQGAEPETPQAE